MCGRDHARTFTALGLAMAVWVVPSHAVQSGYIIGKPSIMFTNEQHMPCVPTFGFTEIV